MLPLAFTAYEKISISMSDKPYNIIMRISMYGICFIN